MPKTSSKVNDIQSFSSLEQPLGLETQNGNNSADLYSEQHEITPFKSLTFLLGPHVSATQEDTLRKLLVDDIKELTGKVINELLLAELDKHIGVGLYGRMSEPVKSESSKTSKSSKGSSNSLPQGRNYRNGSYNRSITSLIGDIAVTIPRDRLGTFQPITINKTTYSYLPELSTSIYMLLAKGLSLKATSTFFDQTLINGISISSVQLISESFLDRFNEWIESPLEPFYPFVFCTSMDINYRTADNLIYQIPIYVTQGITVDGKIALLDIATNEDQAVDHRSFCLGRFAAMKKRGLQDIMFITMDEAFAMSNELKELFPSAQPQQCLHTFLCNTLKHINGRNKLRFGHSFAMLHKATNANQARKALETFKDTWSKKIDSDLIESVCELFENNILPLYDLPKEVRQLVVSTDPIIAANRRFQQVTFRGVFSNSGYACSRLLLIQGITNFRKWNARSIPQWNNILCKLLSKSVTKKVMMSKVPALNAKI